jgi:hypothetical protein
MLWERLRQLRASRRARVVGLTLYYLAIILGLFLAHLSPDYRAAPFIYQAF